MTATRHIRRLLQSTGAPVEVLEESGNPAAMPPVPKPGSSRAAALSTSEAMTTSVEVVDLEEEETTAATSI